MWLVQNLQSFFSFLTFPFHYWSIVMVCFHYDRKINYTFFFGLLGKLYIMLQCLEFNSVICVNEIRILSLSSSNCLSFSFWRRTLFYPLTWTVPKGSVQSFTWPGPRWGSINTNNCKGHSRIYCLSTTLTYIVWFLWNEQGSSGRFDWVFSKKKKRINIIKMKKKSSKKMSLKKKKESSVRHDSVLD